MGESCRKLGDLALGVVRPCPGQEDMYCGIGSCSAFGGMFLNEQTPVRYAKGVMLCGAGVVATGIPLPVAGNSLTLFKQAVGDTALANTNIAAALTLAETNLNAPENQLDVSNFRFCMVGIAAIIEHPYVVNALIAEYRDYLTQVAEYRETMREHVLHNAVLGLSKGNTECVAQLGLLSQYIGSASTKGGDTRSAGNFTGALGYTCLNSVVVEGGYATAERTAITLKLLHGALFQPTSVPVDTSVVSIPVRIEKFGFNFQIPGQGSFYADLPEDQKPVGIKAQGWGG